jgi:hypothetical protein
MAACHIRQQNDLALQLSFQDRKLKRTARAASSSTVITPVGVVTDPRSCPDKGHRELSFRLIFLPGPGQRAARSSPSSA